MTKQLYIAYFYNGDKDDCEVFVYDSSPVKCTAEDLYQHELKVEKEFIKWAKRKDGMDIKLKPEDIDGIYPISIREDSKGDRYQITIKPCTK